MIGISPLIATVILILLTLTIAALIGPWMYRLAVDVTTDVKNDTDLQIICQGLAYDFDTSYASNGINWSSNANSLRVKVINTGTINIYNFSFEVRYNTTQIAYFDATQASQRTSSNVLKPQQTAIIQAANTSTLVTGILNNVKILNMVCPLTSISQNV